MIDVTVFCEQRRQNVLTTETKASLMEPLVLIKNVSAMRWECFSKNVSDVRDVWNLQIWSEHNWSENEAKETTRISTWRNLSCWTKRRLVGDIKTTRSGWAKRFQQWQRARDRQPQNPAHVTQSARINSDTGTRGRDYTVYKHEI